MSATEKQNRRKYRFASRAAAEDAVAGLESSNFITGFCMSAILAGDVAAEFKRGPYRAIVIGPDRMNGGYVVLEFAPGGQRPMAWAYPLDEWTQKMISSNPDPEYAEGQILRDLGFKVLAFANQAMLEKCRRECA